jgi:ArsR family transcriptional regulator, arsenate/arsenite/antimonite-responsive transcriptional repressor
MRQTTKLFKALSDPNRLRILNMLVEKDLCVCEITEILQLATSTVSKHLSLLRDADLILDFKEGRWINYSLNQEIKKEFISTTLNALLKELKNEEQVLNDLTKVKTVDRNNICNR